MEQAFINTVIAFKLMQYGYSLQSFFKEEFKKENGYIIPFSHILYVTRHIFPLIRDSCDYVCPYVDKCDGHKFLDFIEELYQFQHYAVLEKKCFFRDFHFYNFRLKRDRVHEIEFTRWKKFLVGTLMLVLLKIYLIFRIHKDVNI